MKQRKAFWLGTMIALGSVIASGATMAVVSCSHGDPSLDSTPPADPTIPPNGGQPLPSKPSTPPATKPTPVGFFEFDPGTQTITKYTGGPTRLLTIPNKLNGIPVKRIAPRVFYGASIYGVKLPDQLEEIGDAAFCGNYLTELTIPASVRKIEPNAFMLNLYLQSLTFEEGNLEEIGAYAFNSCKGLLSVQLPDSLARPEAKPLGAGSFWSDQGTYDGVPKKISMKEGTKFDGSRFDVFTANSQIYTRTGDTSTIDPTLPTNFNNELFEQVVDEITRITDYKKFDADDMVYAINNYANADIVKAINANKNQMFTNVGKNLEIANIKVSAQAVTPEDVKVFIQGIPLSDGRIGECTTIFKGFTTNAPIPSGYEYNQWKVGDTFKKGGFTYQVIRNPKRTYWLDQPKYALELVDADLKECKLDHLADDNSGKIKFSDGSKGNLSLDLLIIGRHSISKGNQDGCTIGNGETINIHIPDSVYNIEHESFSYINNKVNELYLGNRLEIIDAYVFCKLHYNGTLTIPETVNYIAEGAFSNSEISGKVVWPARIKVLPKACFSWCENITEIVLNEGLERIEMWSMYVMGGVSHDIIIPDSVQYVGRIAFGGCFGHPITVSYPHHLTLTSVQYGTYTNWNYVQRSK